MTTATLTRPQGNILISIFLLPFVIIKKILFAVFRHWYFTSRLFVIFSFFAVIGLCGCFIYQINSDVSERGEISKYVAQAESISQENQNLEISLIKANSANKPDDLIAKLNFEKTEKVSYIKVLASEVVKK